MILDDDVTVEHSSSSKQPMPEGVFSLPSTPELPPIPAIPEAVHPLNIAQPRGYGITPPVPDALRIPDRLVHFDRMNIKRFIDQWDCYYLNLQNQFRSRCALSVETLIDHSLLDYCISNIYSREELLVQISWKHCASI